MRWPWPFRKPDPLDAARTARTRAFEAHRDALARNDSRDIHWTRQALFRATAEVLTLEGRWPDNRIQQVRQRGGYWG